MTTATYADEALDLLLEQVTTQFGSAVKSCWFYDAGPCPGCGNRRTGPFRHGGIDALSLNAFFYRAEGVLIGYPLCGKCAGAIFRAAQKNSHTQTPLHAVIEKNLIRAYRRHAGKSGA